MDRAVRSQLEDIFSDAHVVDVDLSAWDKSVDFYVLADHLPRVEGGRLPLFRVRFIGTRSLKLESDSSAVEGLESDEHVQWLIDDFQIFQESGTITIALSGFTAAPRIEIRCEDIQILPFEIRAFDELFPGWTQPRRGLARLGPAEMTARHGPDG